jgi:enamine deaminase RidA (YjgF/YER057c/UK114 family)
MDNVERISTQTPWEQIAGYSRLVRAGDYVFVSGTTATDERGTIVGLGQMYVQARQALGNIRRALERANVPMSAVVRTRMFVTDISRFADAARAHREFFADSPPATSMVEVRRLVNSQMLIEIEADAYAPWVKVVQPAPVSIAAPTMVKSQPPPRRVAAASNVKPAAKKPTRAKKTRPKKKKRR